MIIYLGLSFVDFLLYKIINQAILGQKVRINTLKKGKGDFLYHL